MKKAEFSQDFAKKLTKKSQQYFYILKNKINNTALMNFNKI